MNRCVDCQRPIPADADPPTCERCRELNRVLVASMIEESRRRHPSRSWDESERAFIDQLVESRRAAHAASDAIADRLMARLEANDPPDEADPWVDRRDHWER